jgi:hypothetical protein
MKALSVKTEYFVKVILLVMIFLFISAAFILALMPPIARDALIHHLAIPKLWIVNGGFYETPWAVYSYYPMNVDLLYLIPLYCGNDIIPNFIHFSFGIGTAVVIYLYLRRKFNQATGLLGFLIFISTPVISKLSTMAYVDLGLVFFIAASVLAFIRWRDGEYKQYSWLLISSVAMGLALGAKYNGLVAWFFLTMAIVFIRSRDTGCQGKAISSGLIFFIVSLAVFSPWLIKNTILTGNPLYPLFPGFFSRIPSGDGGANTVAFVHSHAGLFRTRELFFGESLWEILLIPLRMFFQGQDDNPRYFDGVLNPVLIIFVPFAFMKKNMKIENLFFLLFAVYFILISFFLDQIRIRYILPAIPFLVILTATGLANIFAWLTERERLLRRMCISGLVIILLVLLGLNVIYIQKYFLKIDPVRYLMKKESRDDFISRHDASHPAMMYINKNTTENARIRLILLAGRGYYLNRSYEEDRSMGMGLGMIQDMVNHSGDEKLFQTYLASLDCTHLLIRYELFQQYLQDDFDPEKIEQLKKQMNHALKMIYNDHQYAVFSIIRQ